MPDHDSAARPPESSSDSRTDVLVVGGGLVGASLAIALDTNGMRTTLVEASAPAIAVPPSYDERNLALARASVHGLRAIGVWPHAQAEAMPIRHIHVSRAGDFGSARLDAAREGVDALGWTLPARALGQALLTRLDACKYLQRYAPARVTAITPAPDGWRVRMTTDTGQRDITARLLVGADGTASPVRRMLGIDAERLDYGQTLFVCTVASQHAHAGRAFERFDDQGPAAVLPLAGGRCGLVLTVPAARAAEVTAMDDGAFLALAQRRFGWKLGRLSRPGRRHGYPIHRVAAQRLVAPRAVLVGNAAQTVHPIGAQGFNLGLRDALTLAELLAGAPDPGDAAILAHYAERRASDREATMAMSHGLIRLACLEQPLLGPLRSIALLAFDRVPPLRHALSRRGMGLGAGMPAAVREPSP